MSELVVVLLASFLRIQLHVCLFFTVAKSILLLDAKVLIYMGFNLTRNSK